MHGQDILRGISKVPFEIPHKMSCPYIERYLFDSVVNIEELLHLSGFQNWNGC